MFSSSTPSLSSASSHDQEGGFYGKKTTKTSKKKKTGKQYTNREDKPNTTIDEPEFYPLPRSAKSDSQAHQTRKYQTEYMVPSPLDYDVSTKLTKPRAPSAVFEHSNERDGALWPPHSNAKSEIRPKWFNAPEKHPQGSAYLRVGRSYDGTSSSYTRAPLYSFGCRLHEVRESHSPGPAAYSPYEHVFRHGTFPSPPVVKISPPTRNTPLERNITFLVQQQ